jgi:DNA-binding MarR family transcriptional regulator
LDEEEQATWRAWLAMTARLQAHLNQRLQRDAGLTLADYDVLVPLSEAPDSRLRMFALADRLAWERSRLSHQLSRMQRRGLVAREDCEDDRRGAYVVLTGAGRTAIEQAAPAHVEAVRSLVFDGLDPTQMEALRSFSATVLRRLDAASQS